MHGVEITDTQTSDIEMMVSLIPVEITQPIEKVIGREKKKDKAPTRLQDAAPSILCFLIVKMPVFFRKAKVRQTLMNVLHHGLLQTFTPGCA
ncbi:hypothetical protein [Candidatus Odyssella thessalonicensis]|uniref:hypothetical protein n=1 Tax=Candidatus Odyssella thessalonicensis TaxID=84647 RepID=UPI000225ACAE|nr:hypothetical protein [Candidatus Odyssella thessalonicensis]